MDTIDPTRANAALWRQYLESRWAPWLVPFGSTAILAAAAEGIARAYAQTWGLYVNALFQENAPEVSRFVEASSTAADVLAEPPLAEPVTEHAAIATREVAPEWLTAIAPAPAPARRSTPVRIAAFA